MYNSGWPLVWLSVRMDSQINKPHRIKLFWNVNLHWIYKSNFNCQLALDTLTIPKHVFYHILHAYNAIKNHEWFLFEVWIKFENQDDFFSYSYMLFGLYFEHNSDISSLCWMEIWTLKTTNKIMKKEQNIQAYEKAYTLWISNKALEPNIIIKHTSSSVWSVMDSVSFIGVANNSS